MMSNSETYNGWANYETWNVALYINNYYVLYNLAKRWSKERPSEATYKGFVDDWLVTLDMPSETPDGVPWLAPNLNYEELDEMIRELAEH